MSGSLNLFDRALRTVAPGMAASRELGRQRLRALDAIAAISADGITGATASADGYGDDGGSPDSSRWAWKRAPRDARSDTLSRLPTQRGNSRYLAQFTSIGVGAIRTNVDRVVGTGLALSASPAASILGWSAEQAAEFKQSAQAEFSLFADSPECDLAGRQNFYELQATLLWGVLSSGDMFTLLPEVTQAASGAMPYKLRLQLIEADRCGNPQGASDTAAVGGGIKFEAGRPTAAYIYDTHPGAAYSAASSSHRTGKWIEFVGKKSGRRRLLHHLRSPRPDQPRGVPYLTPVIDDIKRISDYADAEIKAALVSALYTVFVETPSGDPSVIHGTAGGSGDAATDEINLAPGAVIGLAGGEKISIANPGRPNPNFQGFMESVSGLVGMGLGLPRELLLKQFNASYSASKAALLDAWIYFRSVRTWLARSFCQPVYETWMAEAVMLGRIQAPGFFADPLLRWAYTRANWPGDSMGSINPKDEVAAYSAAVDARFCSRERAEWELFGTDWNETFAAKKAEQDMLKAADLLPVPKAGAAAAPTTSPAGTTP